jgi:hypothetical protein
MPACADACVPAAPLANAASAAVIKVLRSIMANLAWNAPLRFDSWQHSARRQGSPLNKPL